MSDHLLEEKEVLTLSPIMPIVALSSKEEAIAVASALVEGGINAIEITLRTPNALEAIEAVAAHVPNMHVGAGTVCNSTDLHNVINSGAQFVFSPGTSQALLDEAAMMQVTLIPGVATPSEMMMIQNYGLTLCKLFPAEVAGGVAMLKAVKGPFSTLKFCPTGGVSEENMLSYLRLDNVPFVGGTWVVPSHLIASKQYDSITHLVKNSLDKIKANI